MPDLDEPQKEAMRWRLLPDYRSVESLLRWRWLAVAISAALVVLIEIAEGHLLDVHALIEVVLFGLIVPSVTWLLLTLLARSIAARAEAERLLVLHRRLTQQLSRRQDWAELTEFVTQFPGTFLPVQRAALFIYDHRAARLQRASSWNAPDAAPALNEAARLYQVCQACLLAAQLKVRQASNCVIRLGPANGQPAQEVCLPLAYNKVLVGMLRLMSRPGQSLTPGQVEFLSAAAPEIALALVLSIAHPRQMSQARAEAEIDERRRIAHDLHDVLAQQIGYLHLSLDRLSADVQAGKTQMVGRELDHMRQVAGNAYEHIRSNLAILRAWEAGDPTSMMVDYAQSLASNTGLDVDVVTHGESRSLPPQTCQQVFNLVREGLNNVLKHARAQRVRLDLRWGSDALELDLVDDGVGFDPATVWRNGHYGLSIMQERVNDLRGEMRVDSAPGRGTTLHFKIPFPNPPPQTSGAGAAAIDE